MAELVIKSNKIIKNVEKLTELIQKQRVEWTLIVKILSGHKQFLSELLTHPLATKLHSIGDSRVSGLKAIKDINPNIVTMYIKPPPIVFAKGVVKYADISLNSSLRTIWALNEEAKKQDKIHRIIIMIEMGELREGVIRDKVLSFYQSVFDMENIKVEGIGTNLGCMYGVQPTYDKLLQLSLYKQLIDAKFDTNLPLISGGSSISLPLLGKASMPKNINHLRIGETAFLGVSPLDGKRFRNLSTDTFEYLSNIIELEVKDTSPDGILTDGNIGVTADDFSYDSSYRAILDFGILDVDTDELIPKDKNVKFAGTTSDMSVYDLGPMVSGKKCRYKVGDKIRFSPTYMAVARLMNSKFIDKRIV